jgi:hypothetical protein
MLMSAVVVQNQMDIQISVSFRIADNLDSGHDREAPTSNAAHISRV